MAVSVGHYLVVAAVLLVLGIFGIFLNRKNIIVIMMSIELILLAIGINLVAFSAALGDLTGQVFEMFVLTVAAAEAAIGLAIVVAGLSRAAGDTRFVVGLRTAVLWIPLVCAYWIAIGLRASFFVPSELPAAWAVRVNGPDAPCEYWSATRATMTRSCRRPSSFTTIPRSRRRAPASFLTAPRSTRSSRSGS